MEHAYALDPLDCPACVDAMHFFSVRLEFFWPSRRTVARRLRRRRAKERWRKAALRDARSVLREVIEESFLGPLTVANARSRTSTRGWENWP